MVRYVPDKKSSTVASALLSIFCDYGFPRVLQSDNGGEFKGAVQKMCEKANIKIAHSLPYKPTTQGKVKCFNYLAISCSC